MNVQFNALLEKTKDYDKDERYMATNDLCNALSHDVKIDENMEKRICDAVLKQLDDQSNDVQSVAVKCLAILLKKVQEAQIGEICDKLCALILDGKDALRDIYSIGLKTLVADVPDGMGMLVSNRLTSKLLNGITRISASDDVKRECLDNMSDLLKRFGHLIGREHEDVMNAVVRQLQHERPIIRKRAALCLGSLAVVLSDALLNRLMEVLLGQIQSKSSDARTLIQTIGTISRTVGHRLGRHLDQLIPLFLLYCGSADSEDESQHSDLANELREHCFPGLESFVLRCRREVTPHLTNILSVALNFMAYDPNYTYESDEETGMDLEDMGEEDQEEEEEEGEYGGSDDDDTSWKVRKAAVRVISSVITARPELLKDLANTCVDPLIARFRDREENVRLDVIACFSTFLTSVMLPSQLRAAREGDSSTTSSSSSSSSSSSTSSSSSSSSSAAGQSSPRSPRDASPRDSVAVTGLRSDVAAVVALLQSKVPFIIRACQKQFQGSSTKTKSAILGMLRSLMLTLRGGLTQEMPQLLQSLDKCIHEKNQQLKLDSLMFLRVALTAHAPSLMSKHISQMLPLVLLCNAETWFKIVAEVLRVIGVIIGVARPLDEIRAGSPKAFDYLSIIHRIYSALLVRLETLDIDQEIKECAIYSAGQFLSHFGDHQCELSEPSTLLTILRRRLDNEVTRSCTLKTLATVAQSPLRIDMACILQEAVAEIALYLRQQNRQLKQSTLLTLDAVIVSQAQHVPQDAVNVILQEAAHLVADTDLSVAHLTLRLSLSILLQFPSSSAAISTHIYPRMIVLAQSPLLQGHALNSIIALFTNLVRSDQHSNFEHIFQTLYSGKTACQLPKQSMCNVAKCIAGMCAVIDDNVRNATVRSFVQDITNADDMQRHLALLCIGELGTQCNLAELAESLGLKNLILSCFEVGSEDSKSAAAFALGHLAVGSMPTFLPVVLQAMEGNQHQYLLLSALKEIIVVHASHDLDFGEYLNAVVPGLSRLSGAEEEGVRNMVAECFGALVTMNSASIVSHLQGIASNVDNKLSRWTVLTALRCALSRPCSAAALAVLSNCLIGFLEMLSDSDLEVRKACLLVINTTVHHNPDIIANHLQDVVPTLFETLNFKLEKVVDLGPFKHKVDEGMPLRKAALTCLETLTEVLPERLHVPSFIPGLVAVLGDKDEIKLQAHQILAKLCVVAPAAIFESFDRLMEPLEKTVKKAPASASKDSGAAAAGAGAVAVGPEAERAQDLVRSGLRVISVLGKVEGVAADRRWTDLLERLTRAGLIVTA